MPSKLRAGGTFPYILEDDRVEGASPQYKINVLSYQQSMLCSDLRAEFIATTDKQERLRIVSELLTMEVEECLISEYKQVSFFDYLTELECWELINTATMGANLSNEQRKKFVSPLKYETGSSVEDAAAKNVATE